MPFRCWKHKIKIDAEIISVYFSLYGACLFNCPYRANIVTQPAAYTAVLVYNRRNSSGIYTALRTFFEAPSAPCTSVSDKIPFHFRLYVSQHYNVMYNVCRVSNIEKLSLRFIQTKYLQRSSGVAGIYPLHISILCKNLV